MSTGISRCCLVFLGFSLTVACSRKDATPAAGGKRGGGGKGIAFPVEVVKVTADPHQVDISAPGVVDAFEHVQITARVSGVVDKVTFVEGQDVKVNQVMAFIDSRRYALSVSSAKAALEGAVRSLVWYVSSSSPAMTPGFDSLAALRRSKLACASACAASAPSSAALAELTLSA